MASLERHKRISLLVVLISAVTGGLFWVGRAYRHQNIPLWRVSILRTKSRTLRIPPIRKLGWSKDGSTLWAQNADGPTFILDDRGVVRDEFTASTRWGTGQGGRFLYSSEQKIYEWKTAATERPDLELPAIDFESNNYNAHSSYTDWTALSVLGSDAHGPVHIWPMQRGQRTLTLSAPTLAKERVSIPYDFAVAPDRTRAVVVYDVTHVISGWTGNWGMNPPGTLSEYGRVVLFDLKTRLPKILNKVDTSFYSPPKMDFGRAGVKFSPSGRLFTVYRDAGGFQIYDAVSGQITALAIIAPKFKSYRMEPESNAFSPDETMFAAAFSDGWIQVWDAKSGSPLQTFHCRTDSVPLSWSPDSKTLAVGSENGDVSLWNVAPFAPTKSQ